MMKSPDREIEIDSHNKSCGKNTERADYSAIHKHALSVPKDYGGQRLDQILARLCPQHSRSRVQNWIRQGRVTVSGVVASEPRQKLWGGETIDLADVPDEYSELSLPEAIALDIVYEDDALIVLDKQAGLVVHPGSGNRSGTLLNALLHHEPALEKVPRAGIVHRLDKDTSGLMVVARTLEAQTALVRQLQARTVKRVYQALVRGSVESGGTVDTAIGRHPVQRTKMAVVHTGKPARTHYRVVERFVDCTLLECALETGRTHQIRVHMTSIGHPLVGDPVYGRGTSRVPSGPEFHRQALHARRLGLVHPTSNKPMLWKSSLPADMAGLIETARSQTIEADASQFENDDWDDEFISGPQIIYPRGERDSEDDDESEQ